MITHHIHSWKESTCLSNPDAVVGDDRDQDERRRLPGRADRAPHPTRAAATATGGRTQLNLKILHKNPAVVDPMGEDFDYADGVQDASTSTRSSATSPR